MEIPLDRAAIQEAVAIADRLNAKVADAIGAYEAAGLHEVDGSVSMQAWLRHECGRDPRTAHRMTAAGRKLHHLPALRDAAVSGRLSAGQVEVILANLPARHLDRFADHATEILASPRGARCDARPARS